MSIKVTIFEDNSSLRKGLSQLINGSEGFTCVGAFPDCSNLITNVKETKPDVVLMDIQMPGMNGVEAVGILKEKMPEIKILMQTIFDDSDRIFQAICAGASGYILKNTPPLRMLDAIRETFEGGAPMSPSIAIKVLTMLKNQPDAKKNESYNLTDREREILSCLVKGMGNKQVAEACSISIDTVRAHIRNIYEKLHVHSRSEVVAKAIKRNIV